MTWGKSLWGKNYWGRGDAYAIFKVAFRAGEIGTEDFLAAFRAGAQTTEEFDAAFRAGTKTTSTALVAFRAGSATTSAFYVTFIAYSSPYYYLNGFDLTDHIINDSLTYKGLEQSIAAFTVPGGQKAVLSEAGLSAFEISFQAVFITPDEYDTFRDAVNSAEEDIVFYPGRSDRYHNIKHISVSRPRKISHGIVYIADVTLKMEDPFLYIDPVTETQSAASLPYTSQSMYSSGSLSSTWSDIKITAAYAGGQHLEDVTLSVMDGSTEEESFILHAQALTGEILELIDGDELTCTYAGDFTASTQVAQDKYASANATVTGGKVVITQNGYLTYKFEGTFATIENIELQANLTVSSGSPSIRYSTDGTNWSESIATADIVSGKLRTYWLSGTEKLAVVYVQFYCPASAALDINSMTFISRRGVSMGDDLWVEPGYSRSLKISDAATSSHTADIELKFKTRMWP